jgi:DNA-binding IclR family transcriptional regulator
MIMAGDVKSARRVIDILAHFSNAQRAQRPMEISRALDMPISSCLSLLNTMARAGVMKYDQADRTYVPTAVLKTLSHWIGRDEHPPA